MHCTDCRKGLPGQARNLFKVGIARAIRIGIRQEFPLQEAAAAHRDIEARKTTDRTILLQSG